MELLVVDSTIRPQQQSRTAQLCQRFLKRFRERHPEYKIETIVLKERNLRPLLDEEIQRREQLQKNQENAPMLALARQFAQADRVLIAAPYWDLCFPALLKIYLEHIFVCGITFAYEGARSVGKCRADKLIYLQSAGGFVGENDPGRYMMQAICHELGIGQMEYLCAEGMDIQEIDREKLWKEACQKAEKLAEEI